MGNQCISTASRKRQKTNYTDPIEYEQKEIFRTVNIKTSTYFPQASLDYYTDLITQIYSQNISLHLRIKISSYLEDEQSYTNISQILSYAHQATILTLDFSNSLLRKRLIFKIIRQRLSEYHCLRQLQCDIGFTYIPNSTIKIFLEGVSKCKSIRLIKLDFQLDIYIKKHNEQKKEVDKKALPNDKITSLVANTLINCKNIQHVSLNFSQIQQKEQDYKSFFSHLNQGRHIRYLELILNNCGLDDYSLEQIGNILYTNTHLKAFILHIANNAIEKISSFFTVYQKYSAKFKENQLSPSSILEYSQNELQEFGFFVNEFKCSEEDLNQFFFNLKYFPCITSFSISLQMQAQKVSFFTSVLNHFTQNLHSISLNLNMFEQIDQSSIYRDKFLKFWRKKKRMVCIKNLINIK